MTRVADTRSGRGIAPGKVILLGEHVVVYGRRALAAAIERHIEVRLVPTAAPARGADPLLHQALQRAVELIGVQPARFAVEIAGDLPAGVGLGSSAAFSVALVRALADCTARPLADADVCAVAFELEKLFHGSPSGIDNTVATYGGLIRFQRGRASRPPSSRPLPLVVAIGHAARRTQQTVAALRQRWSAAPALYEALFDEGEQLTAAAEEAITDGDLSQLGALMSANHGLLRRLGVSTDELDELVALAQTQGALGAKLTGGGGGGAVICLCNEGRAELVAAFSRAGYRAFATEVGQQPRGSDADDTTHLERHAQIRI